MEIKRFRCNGVVLDQPAIDVADNYWTEAANMLAKPNRTSRALGYEEVFEAPLASNPIWLMYAEQLGQPYWIYSGSQNMGVVDSSNNHSLIWAGIPVSVPQGGFTGGVLNGIAIVNGEDNSPRYWYSAIPGGVALELPGLRGGITYRAVRTHRSHIFGMNVVGGSPDLPDEIHWSDGAPAGDVPQTWVPAADNEAGDAILADDGGQIVDGLTLRDSFMIYKRDSVWQADYVGGSLVYAFRKVFSNTGILARNCVVRVKGTHVVLGNGDIYQHDGQNIQSIVDEKVRRSFFEAINTDTAEHSFVVYNEPSEEVWFCAPRVGESVPNIALVWDVVTGEFGYRELPGVNFAAPGIVVDETESNDWDGAQGAWDEQSQRWNAGLFRVVEDSILMADASDTRLLLADSGLTAAGLPYTSAVAKYAMLLDTHRQKAVRRIWPHIDSPEGATFKLELYDQKSPHSKLTVLGSKTFQNTDEGVPVTVNARYLGIRISTEESIDWSVAGFDVEYLPRGRF